MNREYPIQDLVALQEITVQRPYSITHRIELAIAYRRLGYPDLAAGDAYKALLLIDEVVEEGEYHEEAIEAANEDFMNAKLPNLAINPETSSLTGGADVVSWAQTQCSEIAYDILVGCLINCGSLRSAFDYIARARRTFPESTVFISHETLLDNKIRSYFTARGADPAAYDIEEYPEKGMVRRENYPWNHHEPDRTSQESLEFLNQELAKVAPKLVVKVSELPLLSPSAQNTPQGPETQYVKQLGVFARDDIMPGEQILEEKSLLTGISRLHDAYCDACSVPLPNAHEEHPSEPIISCEECDEVFFCSTQCHDLAQDQYHSAVCGVDTDQGKVPAGEAADSLYTLLLFRALALAETQGLHPLMLKEVRYIWGDYHKHELDQVTPFDPDSKGLDAFGGFPRTLPFSFKSNILTPLHFLEKMDVNIFTHSNQYDTWVFNSLYAKFRGTASAQQGLDGRPEIGAVHPLWCLANHSCDPNVAWEWRGSMRFWARENLVDWQGREPNKQAGLKKDDEVFSHYCDVRLPVKERREWAVGALGGDCMCPRCIWEASETCRSQNDS